MFKEKLDTQIMDLAVFWPISDSVMSKDSSPWLRTSNFTFCHDRKRRLTRDLEFFRDFNGLRLACVFSNQLKPLKNIKSMV